MQRQKIGVKESFRVAWRTDWWTVVPVFTAVWWWRYGVPEKRLRRAEGPSFWQLLSPAARAWWIVGMATGAVGFVAITTVVIVLTA